MHPIGDQSEWRRFLLAKGSAVYQLIFRASWRYILLTMPCLLSPLLFYGPTVAGLPYRLTLEPLPHSYANNLPR